jgi:hypothetical protein
MPDETSTPVKPGPTLAENATRLNNNVTNYLAGMVSLSPNLSQDAVLTTGHRFDDTSKVYQQINALRDKITALTKDPNFGAQATTILAELEGSVNANGDRVKHGLVHSAHDQFTALVTGKIDATGNLTSSEFKLAAWEKSFKNITDSIEQAQEQVAKASDPTNSYNNDALTASKKQFSAALKDVSNDLTSIQNDALNADMARINESVQRQSLTQHSELMCRKMYGNNWQIKQFKRIDNPKPSVEEQARLNPDPAADFTMASLDRSQVGIGQDGYYRQENSDYIIRMQNGVCSATYSPIDQTMGQKYDRMKERFQKHQAKDPDDPFIKVGQKYDFANQYRATVEALKQLGNVSVIVFDYKEPSEFSKFHAQNIETAMKQALAGLNKSAADGSKPVGFELGDGAMAGLMLCKEIPDSQRQRMLKGLADMQHEYERQEQLFAAKNPQTSQAAAATTPTTPTKDQESVLKAEGAPATPQNDKTVGAIEAEDNKTLDLNDKTVAAIEAEDNSALDLDNIHMKGIDDTTVRVATESAKQGGPEEKPEQKPEQEPDLAAENKGPGTEATKEKAHVKSEVEPRDLAAIHADAQAALKELLAIDADLSVPEDKKEDSENANREYRYINPESDTGKELDARVNELEQKLDSLNKELQTFMSDDITKPPSKEYIDAGIAIDAAKSIHIDARDSLDESFKPNDSYSFRPNMGGS